LPATVVGLAILLLVAPGYTYAQFASRRIARGRATPLTQLVEYGIVGTACNALAALLSVSLLTWLVGPWLAQFDADQFGNDPWPYIFNRPGDVLPAAVLLMLVLLLGHAFAYGAAVTANRGRGATIRPDASGWTEVLGEGKGKGEVTATVRMLDGRVFTGYVHAYTVGAESTVRDRELILRDRVYLESGSERFQLPLTRLILRGDQVDLIATRFLAVNGRTD